MATQLKRRPGSRREHAEARSKAVLLALTGFIVGYPCFIAIPDNWFLVILITAGPCFAAFIWGVHRTAIEHFEVRNARERARGKYRPTESLDKGVAFAIAAASSILLLAWAIEAKIGLSYFNLGDNSFRIGVAIGGVPVLCGITLRRLIRLFR
jgi:hypothetical protein